jgi:outer membrane protein
MTNLRFYFLSLSLICLAQLKGQSSFSLEESIQYGLQNSSQIKLNQLALADADAQLMDYKSIGFPKLNGSVDYSYFLAIPSTIIPDFLSPAVDGRLVKYQLINQNQVEPPAAGGFPAQFGQKNSFSTGLALNAILYDPAFFLGLKATRLYKDLVTRQNSVTDITIRQSIAKAYLGALIVKKSKEILDQNIATLGKITADTKIIQSKGFVEQIDVDRLDLSLNTLQTEAEKTERLYDVTVNVLKMQMGYPMQNALTLTDHIDQLISKLQLENVDLGDAFKPDQRPEYRSLQLAEELNKIRMRSIKLGAFPSVMGFVNGSYGTQTNNLFSRNSFWFPTAIAGFQVNVPIFDGFKRKATFQRARIEQDKMQIQKSELERAFSLELQNARIQFENAQKTVTSNKNNLDLAQKIYDQAQAKFKAGVGSTLEINQAEASFLQTQSSYIQALYNLLLAKVDIDKALGK